MSSLFSSDKGNYFRWSTLSLVFYVSFSWQCVPSKLICGQNAIPGISPFQRKVWLFDWCKLGDIVLARGRMLCEMTYFHSPSFSTFEAMFQCCGDALGGWGRPSWGQYEPQIWQYRPQKCLGLCSGLFESPMCTACRVLGQGCYLGELQNILESGTRFHCWISLQSVCLVGTILGAGSSLRARFV